MSKQIRLFQRGGKWTFRARIPDDVRAIIGKKEVWHSFGDVSHREAVRLSRIESVKLDDMIAAARQQASNISSEEVSDVEIEHLARAYLHRLEVNAPRMPFSDAARAERRSAAEEAALFAQTVEDAGLQRAAMGVAEESRLQATLQGKTLLRVTEGVQRAMLEHYARDVDRAELRPEQVYDPLFAGVTKAGPPPASLLTLQKAIDIFLSEPERAVIAVKTRTAYVFRFALLADIIGPDRPVSEITRADIREARDVLLKIPPNSTKRYPGTPAREVAAIAVRDGIAPMSPKSTKLYIEALSTLFKWLVVEELAEKNPAVGIKGSPVPDETARRPFTMDELNKLYAAPAFAGQPTRNWLYWLPRLALYSGARFAELLGLMAADVIDVGGVPLLDIKPNAIRNLKTRTSRRLVPVHRELVKLGFLDYAKCQPQNGPLFPDAATGTGDWIVASNHTMSRRLRALIADKGAVFHSFRHTFKDAAERAEVPRDTIAALGGWDLPGGRSAMDGYGRAKLAAKLARELEKVHFEGLRLAPQFAEL